MHPDGKAAAEQQICGSQCPLHFAFTPLLRFRHIDEFSFQQEQMHKFGGSGSVLGEGGLISYPRGGGGGGARVPGWDPAPGHQLHLQLVAVTVHQQPSCPSCSSCSCVCPELEAELCGVGGTAGPPGRELGVAGGGALQLEGTATTRLYSQIRY